MPLTIPKSEPLDLVIGTSWQWDKHFSAAPPSEGYALAYSFEGPSDVDDITAATSPDGDWYEVRELPAFSAGLTAGTYTLVGRVSKAGAVHEVYRQTVTIRSDVAASSVTEPTEDEREAAALRAALDQLNHPFSETVVNGRRVTYRDRGELRRALGKCYARIQLVRNRGAFQRRNVAFTSPAASPTRLDIPGYTGE